MPDEYVASVKIDINGVTHRATALTWFPLTGCADAISLARCITGKKHSQYILKK